VTSGPYFVTIVLVCTPLELGMDTNTITAKLDFVRGLVKRPAVKWNMIRQVRQRASFS